MKYCIYCSGNVQTWMDSDGKWLRWDDPMENVMAFNSPEEAIEWFEEMGGVVGGLISIEPLYDKEYFIEKFSAIPESLWVRAALTVNLGSNTEAHCALGHCGVAVNKGVYVNTPESLALLKLFKAKDSTDFTAVYGVNDWYGSSPPFKALAPGDTPKERILNYLKQL